MGVAKYGTTVADNPLPPRQAREAFLARCATLKPNV